MTTHRARIIKRLNDVEAALVIIHCQILYMMAVSKLRRIAALPSKLTP